MATVTSITAERAQAIENASIVDAELSGVNLILKTRGGSQINVGAVKSELLDAWPVNSIYIGATSTSPATLLGGGTWARFGQGRVLVSQSDSDTEFDTALETGGEKSHTLSIPELPSHSHGGGTGYESADHAHGAGTFVASNAGNHQHNLAAGSGDRDAGSQNTMVPGAGPTATTVAGDHGHAIAGFSGGVTSNHNHAIGAEGGGGAHNNLQPYIVVYMWRRTA